MNIITNLQTQLYQTNPLPISDSNPKGLTYAQKQFDTLGSEKNILYVDTQLSGRHLYRFILPALGMKSEKINTAFTDLWKYNQKDQLMGIHANINVHQIIWADFIVLPFTTEDLTALYNRIKQINKHCEIVFCVDFNYYELSEEHPYYELFTPEAIHNIENNIWFSDITMVTNMPFRTYLVEKMQELITTKMQGINTNALIACMPYFIDAEIVLENVNYKVETPEHVEPVTANREPENKKQLEVIATEPEILDQNVKQIRVMYENYKWVLKKGKQKKPIEIYAKKTMAIEETDKWVKKGFDIIIYNMSGIIQKHITLEHQKKE